MTEVRSVDPLIDHNDPQQMHGYAYANNNPITYTDPNGLAFFECTQGGSDCTGNSGLGETVGRGNNGAGRKPDAKDKAEGRVGDMDFRGDVGPGVLPDADTNAWAFYGKPFHELAPRQQQIVLKHTACQNTSRGSEICKAMRAAIPQDALGAFIAELIGLADLDSCMQGSLEGCAWLIAGFTPAKLLKLGKALDAAGAATKLNRAGRPYPDVIDPRTGSPIHFPGEGLTKVPVSERVPWGRQGACSLHQGVVRPRLLDA